MNMKCSAIHLLNRSEYNRRKSKRNIQQNIEPVYITKGYHGYSFTFLKSYIPTVRKEPVLSINNIDLPESACTLNMGYSLKKWSSKMPRLKSSTKKIKTNKDDSEDPEYDMSYTIDNILERIDNSEDQEHPVNSEEYELHSDIEELLRKSAEVRQQEVGDKHRSKLKDRSLTAEDKPKKRSKNKTKKTIRFSISKPTSPRTEQIIRVDVTSNITVEELREIERSRSVTKKDDSGRISPKVINECSKKESDGTFTENGVIKFDGEDEEFIIRCSQLALTQKRR